LAVAGPPDDLPHRRLRLGWDDFAPALLALRVAVIAQENGFKAAFARETAARTNAGRSQGRRSADSLNHRIFALTFQIPKK
jgi:hypothetical protein